MSTKGLLKKITAAAVAAACVTSLFALVGCGGGSANQSASNTNASAGADKEIAVYSREDGSGTRGAFIELFGLEEKDANGKKVDTTTDSAAITNSTSVMMTSVASDPAAVGYISLGSLNDSVKAVQIDGVDATASNVKSGTYKVSRPFNIVTNQNLNPAAQDFITFIMSADGQKIVEDNKYIAAVDGAPAYKNSGASGKVVVAGSSSVTPVMEKLAEAYKAANPGVTVEVQQSDSTTGVTMAIEGTADIGMASRELKDSEKNAEVKAQPIAIDGIAVIVSPNSAIKNLTSQQVKDIFNGTLKTWAEVLG